ncbi:MAG: tRNA-(ms[2]io[6]A)-hydroxylase [Pirellulales bacterium]
MLSLGCPTPDTWWPRVESQLDELLVDHAHCEKKAAGTAMNLIFAYVEREPLCRALAEIVNEELEHFGMVLDLLAERGVPFRRLVPSRYGRELNDLVRKQEPQRAVDRMLVAALIEARSCERFALLRDLLKDREPRLAEFYGGLFESEARHHATYVRFAKEFGPANEVDARLAELAADEARIITAGEALARMHS